jgi:nitroreductase/NAD-dependent dihydropyrimidine dehydrogenase PreA subunit
MGLLIIDKEKCKKDGICASVCPAGLIRLQGEEGYPAMIAGGEPACVSCGHCVAVCSQGALSHEHVPIEQCQDIKEELTISKAQAWQFLRSRRAIRLYEDRPVERDKIQELIEVARYAPTGGNSQLVEWLVLTDKVEIKELAGLTADWLRQQISEGRGIARTPYAPLVLAAWDEGYDRLLRNAPVPVVASVPKLAAMGIVELTISLSYLELAALKMGLGTCWAGFLQRALLSWPPLQKALRLPEGHIHHYPMMLGYPKVRYFRLPERKPPKITWR